jgi:hypothetical protein
MTGKRSAGAASRTQEVDDYIAQLEHPRRAEVQAVRETIRSVHPDITEEIKWKAPSFSYRGAYLVTFNLRDPRRVMLVFHNPAIPHVESDWLEGDYRDRRLAYLTDMEDVRARAAELQRIVGHLVRLEDEARASSS